MYGGAVHGISNCPYDISYNEDMLGPQKNPLYRDEAAAIFFPEIEARTTQLTKSWAENHVAFTESHRKTALMQSSKDCEVVEQLESCISTALESLNLSVRLYNESTVASAHYAVIRTAIETTSLGIWLGNTGKKREILSKSIKLSYRDNENLITLAEFAHKHNREQLKNRKKKRERLKHQFIESGFAKEIDFTDTKAVEQLEKKLGAFSGYLQIIKEADKRLQSRKLACGEVAWRMCSGAAHGSRDIIIGTGIAELTGISDETTEEVALRRDSWNTVSCMLPAVENCEKLIEIYRRG
jgi:hypothetical protein